MQNLESTYNIAMAYLPGIIGAIVVLAVGFWIASFVANKLGKLLSENKAVKKLLHTLTNGNEGQEKGIKVIVKIVYYILVLFVLGAVLEMFNLDRMTGPINSLIDPIFAFIPNLLAAVLIGIIAYVLAFVVRMLVVKLTEKLDVDNKVSQEFSSKEGDVSISKALADIVFWLIIFLFLPLILSSLGLTGILSPLQNMINKVLQMLPNIFTAGIVLFIGWFIAGKIRDVITSLTHSVGVDSVLKNDDNDTLKLSEIIGLIAYVLVLIPVIGAGLSILGLESLARPVTNMIDQILGQVPVIFSALVIVGLAYFLGKIVGEIVTGVVAKLDLEKPLKEMNLLAKDSDVHIGALVGNFVQFIIIFFAALQAFELIGFTQITELANKFIVLLGQIGLGLVIIAAGFYVANIVAGIIKKQATKSSDLLANVAKAAIIFLSVAMGLSQMGVADKIVEMAFGYILGATALAAALAFGLGGKEEAAKFLAEKREKK